MSYEEWLLTLALFFFFFFTSFHKGWSSVTLAVGDDKGVIKAPFQTSSSWLPGHRNDIHDLLSNNFLTENLPSVVLYCQGVISVSKAATSSKKKPFVKYCHITNTDSKHPSHITGRVDGHESQYSEQLETANFFSVFVLMSKRLHCIISNKVIERLPIATVCCPNSSSFP